MTKTPTDIDIATQVLNTEIQGLEELKHWLSDGFKDAIDLLSQTTGRIIISGMGKSGHIGKKIAATLASTGSPAYFVHPGEASHGDLGMISKDDVVILLSNSGETQELTDIIDYTKRFSIPLIGIVRRETSILTEAADVALVLPNVPEACHINAPTTSTTMMLALGDVLAVTLLSRKGFTMEDFGVFHPGGKLGSAFIKVKDLMHSGEQLPVVSPETPMTDALIEMTVKRFGCTAIVNHDGILLGIITDGDLRRHMGDSIISQTAIDVMTKDPVTIKEHQLASESLAIMQKKSITNLFVTDQDNKPIGIIHIHDLLRAGVV